MKCAVHTKEDAVGVCRSCGSGVCIECKVMVYRRIYCRTCARPYQPRQIVLKPKRKYFTVGAVGFLLLAVSWVLLIINGLFLESYVFRTIFNIIFCVGVILGSVAFFGFRKNYYSALGLVAFIFTMIIIWIVLAGFLLTHIVSATFDYLTEIGMWIDLMLFSFSPLVLTTDILSLVGVVVLGVMYIFWSIALIVNRRSTGKIALSIISGVFAIISGILQFITAFFFSTDLFYFLPPEISVIFDLVRGFMVILTGVTGLILLIVADVPKGEQVITSRVRFLPMRSRAFDDEDDDWPTRDPFDDK